MTLDHHADLVLLGGRIATMDPARSWADSLAVRAGRVAAVGSDDDVRQWIGRGTRVIELRGRTVTPGFQDAHIHPVTAGLDMRRCDLLGIHGAEATLEAIARYARTHPDEAWIRGSGWNYEDFEGGMPDVGALDRILPDRPVYLEVRDGHTAWVNSRALELAGITADTLDPSDGRIDHDVDGAPRGTLQEGAIDLVYAVLPPDKDEEMEAALELAQAHLHALGITAWQDANVSPELGDSAYVALASDGRLTARVVGAMWWDHHRGGEQIDEFVERRSRTSIGRYAATSVKLMLDGVVENFTAAMIKPYSDPTGRPRTDRGLTHFDPEHLGGWVARLDALGLQAHFHAIGDAAIRDALDAVAVARAANGPSDTRPHISHIQVIHPDDLGRFRALGVAANAQPYWACHEGQMERLTIPHLGDRWRWQYPFRSLKASGTVLAMGSDWAVSTPDPLLEMEVAVERIWDGHRDAGEAFLPDERLDLVDALAAFTAGSAYVNHLDETGSLQVGRLADLVVLDRDLFDRATGPIGDARVVGTFIEGDAVFEDPALDG